MSEHDETATVVAWCRFMSGQYPCLAWLHAIPNGSRYGTNRRLAAIEARKQHEEGLLPGVPDLFLPFPARNFNGFYIEMKSKGKLSEVRDGQVAFLAYAESVGYLAQVHDSADSAIEAITWYLSEASTQAQR
jgi:hypothetical protein